MRRWFLIILACGLFGLIVRLSAQYPQGIAGGAGFLSVNNASTEMANIGTTYTQVTAFDTALNVGANNLITCAADTDLCTINVAGAYLVAFQISFTGTAVSTFECAVFLNTDTELGAAEFRRKMGASGDVGAASAFGVFVLAATNTLMLKCHGDTAGDDMTPTNVQLVVVRIG